MEFVIDGLSWACLLAGGLLTVIAGVGLLRLPDVYARMHAAGITDTLGAGLMLLGLGLQAGFTQISIKLALILIFLVYTSPAATHALAKAAFVSGLRPRLGGAPRQAPDERTSPEERSS